MYNKFWGLFCISSITFDIFDVFNILSIPYLPLKKFMPKTKFEKYRQAHDKNM